MNIQELKLQLAEVIEGLAATDRRIAELSASLMAMRLALRQVSPARFEPSYAKQYEGAECQRVRSSSGRSNRCAVTSRSSADTKAIPLIRLLFIPLAFSLLHPASRQLPPGSTLPLPCDR